MVVRMIRQEISHRAASDLAGAKDNVLLGIFSRMTGEEPGTLNIAAMTGRIVVARFPNGVEQFQLDGVPIVEFYPIEINARDDENSSYFVSVAQKYRVLTPSHNPADQH
jgi:hypothetical protein